MADYHRGWLKESPAGWLPVHRDQLWAQHSVTSMGELYLYFYWLQYDACCNFSVVISVCLWRLICSLLENLPEDVSPGQAIWCPNDLGIICVGWWHVPYRLGRIYCDQRRSALFHIDLKNYTCTTLGPTDRSVSNPVFSRDQTRLVFLENDAGGPHRQCSRLAMCDWYVFHSAMSPSHWSHC